MTGAIIAARVALDDATLDALATPLLRLDAAGTVAFANTAMARWLGVGKRRLVGLQAAALERDDGQLAARLARPLETAVRLRRVGLAACPADAVPEVRAAAHVVSAYPGGRGAARSLIEDILRAQGRWDALIDAEVDQRP